MHAVFDRFRTLVHTSMTLCAEHLSARNHRLINARCDVGCNFTLSRVFSAVTISSPQQTYWCSRSGVSTERSRSTPPSKQPSLAPMLGDGGVIDLLPSLKTFGWGDERVS